MKRTKSLKIGSIANDTISISYGGLSDTGCMRESNEDRMFLQSWKDGCALLAVVADGMGGHASGEVAAQIAVDTFARLLENPLPTGKKERYDSLMDCFGEADAIICEQSAQDIHLQGMGTTVVATIITPQECLFLYAGDSRLYHIRNDRILYVTPDHSVIRLLLETGCIKPEDSATHPMRSVITSCLGGEQNTRLTVEPNWIDDKSEHNPAFISVVPGDLIILCSDGLYNEVIDESLIGLILASNDPDELCKALVKEAKDAGGHDNITVIAVSISESIDQNKMKIKQSKKQNRSRTKTRNIE